jgi:hypothetical protein
MEIIKKIIEPENDRKPYYRTVDYETDYTFSCDECGKSITLDSNNQIKNCWIGKSDSITQRDFEFMKAIYKIGLSNKSTDGGLPVFDRLICLKCESKYISYCGVREYSNSAYLITLNGLIKTESANLTKTVRNNIIEILDLLGDYDKQIEYAKTVGDVIAIQEMICMWFDDKYHPQSENFIKAFSENELTKLKDFNDYYDLIFKKLPDKNIKTLHIDLNWEKLVERAKLLNDEIKNATQHAV